MKNQQTGRNKEEKYTLIQLPRNLQGNDIYTQSKYPFYHVPSICTNDISLI